MDVRDIDFDQRRLIVETLGQKSELNCDSLILATGADQSYFCHPEYARTGSPRRSKPGPAMKSRKCWTMCALSVQPRAESGNGCKNCTIALDKVFSQRHIVEM